MNMRESRARTSERTTVYTGPVFSVVRNRVHLPNQREATMAVDRRLMFFL